MAISPNLPSTLDTGGDSRSVQTRAGAGAIAKRLFLWLGRLLFQGVRGLLFGLGRLVGEVVKAAFMLTMSLVKTVLVVLVILLTLQAAVREIGYAPLVRYVTEEAASDGTWAFCKSALGTPLMIGVRTADSMSPAAASDALPGGPDAGGSDQARVHG